MPVNTTQIEARRIITKKSDAITRFYPGGVPFQVGDKTTLFLDTDQGPREYAQVTIKTLRPCSLDQRRKDEGLAAGEGFGHPVSWEKNLRSLYGSVIDAGASSERLMRVRFDVDKVMTDPEKAPEPKFDPDQLDARGQ